MTMCKQCLYRIFKADWPSALGWVLTLAIAWQYIGTPILDAAIFIFQGSDRFTPEQADASHIFALMSTLLGMAGLKTYERVKSPTGTAGETKIVAKEE